MSFAETACLAITYTIPLHANKTGNIQSCVPSAQHSEVVVISSTNITQLVN